MLNLRKLINMNLNNLLNLVKTKKQTIISIVVLVLLVVSVATFVQPLNYGASSRLLVVQNFPVGTDPYAISRSNEMITNVLAQVLKSDSFYNQVINSDYNIERSYFRENNDSRKEMKKWSSTVDAKVLNDKGMVDIRVYHPDRYQVNQISQAINYVYQTKNADYHGLGNMVSIRVINRPYVSNWPVKPNIVFNYSFGFLLAFLISLVYIYIFPEEKYNIRLWPKRKFKKEVDQEYANEAFLANLNNNAIYSSESEEQNRLENILNNNYENKEAYLESEEEKDIEPIDLNDEDGGLENNIFLQRGGDIRNLIG